MRGEYYHGGDGEGGLLIIQLQTAPTQQLALGLELISSCHNSYYFSRDETKNISHFYFQILENN